MCYIRLWKNRLSPLFTWKATIKKATIWLLFFYPSSFDSSHIDFKIACVSFPYCRIPSRSFVDYHLKPLVASIPSYVKDTNDFLHKLADIERLPEAVTMVSINVACLYPDIPHDEGYKTRVKS